MTRNLLTAASLLALTACGTNADELTEVLPDDRLMVNMPTDLAASTARADLGEFAEFYIQTASATDDVNGLIGDVLTLVDEVTDLRPTDYDRDSHTAIWGPFSDDLDPVQTTLTVQYNPDTDVHSWWFAQSPKGAGAESEVAVIAGEVDAGATRDASTGRFIVDFRLIAELNPGQDTSGAFTSEYDISPDGVVATATLQDWEDLDDDSEEIGDAAYLYAQTVDGEGLMDLVISADYLEDGGTNDIYVLRSRWDETGAGRGDAALADPDQPEEKQLVAAAVQCWDDRFKLVYQAVAQGNGFSVDGDAGACVYEDSAWDEE